MTNFLRTFIVLAAILSSITSLAAHRFHGSPLGDRIDQSELVVSGLVISSTPFYNDRGRIMTRHEIEVYEIFRGRNVLERVQVITQGGQINEERCVVTPSLQLQIAQQGVFLLKTSNHAAGAYRPVDAQASLIAKDPVHGTFIYQGEHFSGDDLNHLISHHLGRSPVVNTPMVTAQRPQGTARQSTVNITSFNPTIASAGTETQITIDGSGFGNDQGNLFFDDPNDGSGGAFSGVPPSDIISWSDNQIVATIPGTAGTGSFIVQATNGMSSTSSSPITITFAVTTLGLAGQPSVNPRLIDDMGDGDGGYRLEYSSNTANNGVSFADDANARAAFERAINSWQQDPGAQFAIYAGVNCGTTTIQEPLSDGVNVISYDNDLYDFDVELNGNTAAVAFSNYSSCGSSEFELVDLDIFFRRDGDPNNTGGAIDWWYGNGSQGIGQFSFEATALHELGHSQQLSHVIDPAELMHFTANTGTNNITISQGASDAAAYVRDISLAYNPPFVNCGAGNDFLLARQYETYDAAEDCGAVAAPVSYLSFTGYRSEAIVQLEWSTAFERNNQGFIVQRSHDGRSFTDIGTVAGNGNSQGTIPYDFQDFRPLSGTSYYRLAQLDFDGAVNLSQLVRVNFTPNNVGSVSVAPNPFHERLIISGISLNVKQLQLFNAQGQIVFTKSIGSAQRQSLQLELVGIPSGVYWLKTGDKLTRLIRR